MPTNAPTKISSPPVDVELGGEVGSKAGADSAKVVATPSFDPDSTMMYQSKMKKAPVWFCSFLAGNSREKRRLGDELGKMKGALPLLLKQRQGGAKWTPEEKVQLKGMVKSASSVSPYLFIWALPGSMVMLPFLAWYIDKRRKAKILKAAQAALDKTSL